MHYIDNIILNLLESKMKGGGLSLQTRERSEASNEEASAKEMEAMASRGKGRATTTEGTGSFQERVTLSTALNNAGRGRRLEQGSDSEPQ